MCTPYKSQGGLWLKVRNELIEGILAYSKDMHPKEVILLLKGKIGDDVEVDEVVIPPLSVQGHSFSLFQPHMIPFDLSILGVVHSHPSGILKPSIYDLNHFYGRIMMIAAYPYYSAKNIAIFNNQGKMIPFTLVS